MREDLESMRRGSRRWKEARVASVERMWGPRSVVVEDGPARGMRQIELRHLGGLAVDLEVDQFLDLGDASFRGVPLSFVAPTTSPRAESWSRRWRGGLMTTCGLAAVGRAEQDIGGMHGRAHLIPASVTRSEGRWDGDDYVVEVRGLMREGALFDQNVSVARTIRASVGASALQITDEVRNEGFERTPLRLLYHFNVGWPWLEEGAAVETEAQEPGQDEGSGNWERTVEAPKAGEPETVDALIAVPDADGWASARIQGSNRSITVRFRPEQLPYLTVWRSKAAGSYVVGLEPGTCWPGHVDGPDFGKAGVVLAPGESRTVNLEFEVQAD